MKARIEAAVKAWDHYWGDRYGDEALEEMGEEVTVALSAADAVMFSDDAVERTERVLTMHAVTTDGLAEGAGWCAECGNVGDDNEYHLARAVIAALKGDA